MKRTLGMIGALGLAALAGVGVGIRFRPSQTASPEALLSALIQPALAADAPQVLHFDHDKVDFNKGVILVDGSQTNYKVHASVRNKAGVPELHAKDTDIFYIRSGKATFVTGGTVKGLTAKSPDESLGESIDGGKEHSLTAGDVIIIPKGVPHWFRDVPGEVTYFVVKVR